MFYFLLMVATVELVVVLTEFVVVTVLARWAWEVRGAKTNATIVPKRKIRISNPFDLHRCFISKT